MYTCKYLCLWSFILFLLQWDKIPYSSFQGSIAYEVDGYLSAPAYFDVERSTGRIIIRNDFSLDITTSYLVSFSKLLNSENVLSDTIKMWSTCHDVFLPLDKTLSKCIVLIID